MDESRIATGPDEQLPDRDQVGTAAPTARLRGFVPLLRARLADAEAWVLFEHGTVVLLPGDPGPDPLARAKVKLGHDAERRAGSAAGDPAVLRLEGGEGWIVSSEDPDVFTLVPASTITAGSSDVVIGAAGRAAHEADVDGGRALHVEPPTG